MLSMAISVEPQRLYAKALKLAHDIVRALAKARDKLQDGITSAIYDWAELAVSITISDKEKRQNAGEAKVIDLLKAKTTQSEVSIRELLNNCLMAGKITSGASSSLGQFSARTGRLDSGASGPLPLAALIDSNASRSVS